MLSNFDLAGVVRAAAVDVRSGEQHFSCHAIAATTIPYLRAAKIDHRDRVQIVRNLIESYRVFTWAEDGEPIWWDDSRRYNWPFVKQRVEALSAFATHLEQESLRKTSTLYEENVSLHAKEL